MLALWQHFTQIILFIAQNNPQCQVQFISCSAGEAMNTQRAEFAEVHIVNNRAPTNCQSSSPSLLQSHFPEQFSLVSTPFFMFVQYTHTHLNKPHYFSWLLLLTFFNTWLVNYHLLRELPLTPIHRLGPGHLPCYPENTTIIDCCSILCKYHLIVCVFCHPVSALRQRPGSFCLYLCTQHSFGIPHTMY